MNTTNQPTPTATALGRPQAVPDAVISEIRRRAATETAWGDQKRIALDHGLSCSFVNQVIRGFRRKPITKPIKPAKQTVVPKLPIIPDNVVAEIRRRAATETAWGCQKVIALDLGLSRAFVNQVIRGYRRKLT